MAGFFSSLGVGMGKCHTVFNVPRGHGIFSYMSCQLIKWPGAGYFGEDSVPKAD